MGNSQETQGNPETNQDNQFSNDFLNGIPEQDREIVGKYVSQWDKGVQERFNTINTQWAPYKDLGDIEDLKRAIQVSQAINDDPIAFYNEFTKILDQLKQEGLLDMEDNVIPNTGVPSVAPTQTGVDSNPYEAKIAELEASLAKMNENFTNSQKAAQDKEEMQRLDNLMKDLHTKHGAFDDDYFLLQLQRGKSPEEAIKAWQDTIENAVSSRNRPNPPKIPMGGGNVPSGQVDPSKMSEADRIKYLTSLLQQANN